MEFDPLGFKPHEPGAKLDAGKPSVWRGLFDYFPRACLAVATVSTLGAKKYSWKGWESVPDGVNRYGDALARHMLKEGMGEIWDPETGELHATHAAWNAFARLELMLRQQEEKGK